MGWLVARTDMPLRRTVRAAGHRVVRDAAVPRRHRLGAAGGAQQRPAQPALPHASPARRADEHLFNIYSFPGLIFVIACYTFPYVFVLVANALDRMPGDLEDASSILGGGTWVTARRITIPLVLPALLAGALVAFLQAMTLFGSPAILALPAGFHTMTTKIWSLFQYPPKPELAAAASLPLLILTVMLLRAEHMILGRRSYAVLGGKNSEPRLIRLGWLRWVALAFCFIVLLNPVFLPYGALLNAAFSQGRVAVRLVQQFHASTTSISCSSSSPPPSSRSTTPSCSASPPRPSARCIAVVISYLTTREAVTGHSALGFLATAPVAIPGIVLGVGLFLSYTRPPFVLYGTLWILLLAFLTIAPAGRLPADAVGVQARSIPSSRTPAASSARRGCARSGRSRRRCCAPA